MRTVNLLGVTLLLLGLCNNTSAQLKAPSKWRRCGTTEALQQTFKEHPEFKAAYDRKNAEPTMQRRAGDNITARTNALAGPVTIPVIVHVVLPIPALITEEQIDYLLNRLNLDYSGLNADSTNAAAFYPVRGHSLLRFTRARRTPGGQITNGIERRAGSVVITQSIYQNIKHASAGGLDPWDVTQYYNLWVGTGDPTTRILGIAPAIGVGNQTETTASTVGIDGVCIDYSAFSNGCFSNSSYALGRTVVHEIGHNFGLYHTFEGCAAGDDFAQPTPANQILPANLVGATGDDTPGLSVFTSSCPAGAVASDCSGVPNPPGKMYQNYMDYTYDPCYSLFTTNQVARMEYMLETYRPGYLTTQGAVPPAGFPAIDAAINAVVSPGGAEFNNGACTLIPYPAPICPGLLIPRLSILNVGSATLTSITVTVTLTGATSGSQTTTIAVNNLITDRTTTIALPSVLVNSGTTTITFTITQANGVADTYTTNNIASVTITTTVSGSSLPFTQNFTGTTFPPANMTLFNPNGNTTWGRGATGNGNIGSAFIDNFDNNLVGDVDGLQTVPLRTSGPGLDSVIITFDVAHKYYPGSADTLQVLASADCGTTFVSYYNKSGVILATNGSSSTSYINPAPADWRTERVSIPYATLNSGTAIVRFQNTNDFGNNIFIDNINITGIYKRDLQLLSVNQPSNVVCTTTITPNVTVRNTGVDTIRGFKMAYVLDNGAPVVTTVTGVAIPKNGTQTLNLPVTAATSIAPHSFRAYTVDPITTTGTGDQNTLNDTLVKTFTVIGTVAAPLVEGFEVPTFPPTGWAVVNPDGAITWQRTSRARRSTTDTASAYVNNYAYLANGTRDELYTPQITYTGVDSVFLNFDVAATTYSYPGSTAILPDTMEVLVTNDCGVTYTSVYKKWGTQLQTVNDPNLPQTTEFIPSGRSQWRNEYINLSAYASRSPIGVVFRNTTNAENNIFIDNVNLSTKTLPAKLKEQGYLIYPIPFASTFFIQHYLPPTELSSVVVYNSVGQSVWAREYGSAGASSSIQIDLSRFANDLYTVVLRYTTRTVSQKIIKAN